MWTHSQSRAAGLSLLLLFFCKPAEGSELFRLFSTPIAMPERDPLTGYVLLTPSNKFTFLPPPGWSVSGNPEEKKVTLSSRDLSASISFTIHPAALFPADDVQWEVLRQRVRARFPDAKIIREFECSGVGQSGLGFDLDSALDRHLRVSRRIEFVPLDGGVIEFDLTVTAKSFADYHFPFENFIGSFQVERLAAKK